MKNVQYINPDGLNKNPAFSNVVIVPAGIKTIFIGGQDSINESGEIIGKGDIKKQTEQVLNNIKIALKSAGAGIENIIKWNIYIVQGNDPGPAFEISHKIIGKIENPPAITVVFVSSLVNPDFLVEIDAIAVVNE
ncbi:RidA family protein [Methanobacterium sp. ACI-7]|uniref:RidA family protein n=1 Tax=unclassified Methanobacterium TaxID=2627676 RepID=UPI0039C4D4E1